MAGIDKTYINGKDYLTYRNWWIDNYYKMKRELGEPIYLYTFDYYDEENITPEFLLLNVNDKKYYKTVFEFPIWNTTEAQDKWLIKNCDIPSFRKRMLEVYDYKWIGFKKQKWAQKATPKMKFKKRRKSN